MKLLLERSFCYRPPTTCLFVAKCDKFVLYGGGARERHQTNAGFVSD